MTKNFYGHLEDVTTAIDKVVDELTSYEITLFAAYLTGLAKAMEKGC